MDFNVTKEVTFSFWKQKEKKPDQLFLLSTLNLGYSSLCYFCPICFIVFITKNKIFIRKKNRYKVWKDLYRMYEISLNLAKYNNWDGKKKCRTDLKKKVGKKASTKQCFFCLLSLFNEYHNFWAFSSVHLCSFCFWRAAFYLYCQ